MNFSTKGNDTLIRWAIFPAGSADYMSHTTAMVTFNLRMCKDYILNQRPFA